MITDRLFTIRGHSLNKIAKSCFITITTCSILMPFCHAFSYYGIALCLGILSICISKMWDIAKYILKVI